MQKRFLYIAIRKYDFVEKRARKVHEQKSEKHASRNPKSTRAKIQKSARAEIRKARKRKPEKRASRNPKSARAEAGKAREPKKEKP